MRVLLLPGTHDCANLGDVAMLQVAVERLRALWPDARLHALIHPNGALQVHCPGVHPASLRGRDRWLRSAALPRSLFPNLPSAAYEAFPPRRQDLLRTALLAWPPHLRIVRSFANALFRADLVVMAGCGMLTDAFASNAIRTLDTLEAAHRAGIATALLGQGLGPATDPALVRRAAEVLPRLGPVFVRERRASLPLLRSWGVPASPLQVTGDDAVELSHRHRSPVPGKDLGLNIRLARYSGVDPVQGQAVRDVLMAHARSRGVRLLGVPILCAGKESDIATLEHLLAGAPVPTDPGTGIRTTSDLAQRVSLCRIVVTGSYHGAVFALAQGIPAVCLAESSYYHDKFLGLADLFPGGCHVIAVRAPGFTSRLAECVRGLWDTADALRPSLLEAAGHQIRAGTAACASLASVTAGQGSGAVPGQTRPPAMLS